ncbi:hypothetical protein Misp06_01880 [Microbulbifer sp. NBRC 101763]|uniref:hypothetical protein n=1 Tax=Microbulbifer TaxID=48073 RepID=UPI0003785AF8|nr:MULTISPECIES: hypothetical protein [Microbulbifer]WHI51182.1 hypothetical protein P3339_22750 [Microbulbifer sp. MLAF003]
MNLRYLCANHRQWLFDNRDRAEKAWLDWMERGRLLIEDGHHSEAIPYLGCAFDVAGMLLARQWPSYAVSAQRFSESAASLMEAYREQGDEKLHHYILAGASSVLARQLGERDKNKVAAECISALYPDGSGEFMSAVPRGKAATGAETSWRLH